MLREVGKRLRSERENLGLEISDVSRRLMIRSQYIKAIEQNITSDLPSNVYRSGYIRTYAKLLGMQAQEIEKYIDFANQKQYNDYNITKEFADQTKPNPALLLICSFLFIISTILYSILAISEPSITSLNLF